jgi:hypothetical protein
MKLGFFSEYFRKILIHQFNENPSSGSQGVPCEQTNIGMDGREDGHDEANGRF